MEFLRSCSQRQARFTGAFAFSLLSAAFSSGLWVCFCVLTELALGLYRVSCRGVGLHRRSGTLNTQYNISMNHGIRKAF